jgi:hypothetical protein
MARCGPGQAMGIGGQGSPPITVCGPSDSFVARPIQLSGVDGFGREHRVFVRFKDGRGALAFTMRVTIRRWETAVSREWYDYRRYVLFSWYAQSCGAGSPSRSPFFIPAILC